MKRSVALALVFVMCLSLCACYYPVNPAGGKTDCTSCGKSISVTASFCEHCGIAVKDVQSTTPFESLSFSGTGHKAFRDINLPNGQFVIIGNATLTGDYMGIFDVYLKKSDGYKSAYWFGSVSSNEKNIEKIEPFSGPLNGGCLEVDAEDNVSWTITIEAAK